jgi:uncharacterized protein (TIGR00255 family)
MIKSMTGYGRAALEQDGYRLLVEIKAVNHRFTEVVVRMPREYLAFEDRMKKAVLERVARGRLDVYVTVEKTAPIAKTVVIDEDLAVSVKRAFDALAERLGLEERLPLSELLRQEGLLSVKEEAEDPERLGSLLIACTGAAADDLIRMRLDEGERLAREFAARLVKLRRIAEEIAARSPQVVEEYRNRLRERIEEALGGTGLLDEARLLTEVAIFADRASIDEELTRLNSHFQQFEATLQAEEPVGRKLDFLVQEMNREVNTIGSKANDLEIACLVVEAKSTLEQIREQIQNVE